MAYLSHIATANPPYRYDQQDIEAYMAARVGDDGKARRKLRAIYQHAQIGSRYSVLPDFGSENNLLFSQEVANISPSVDLRMAAYAEHAPALAAKACTESLLAAGLAPAEVTHIITVSCTGLMAPGLEVLLVERLGLAPTTTRMSVNFVGCHAAFQALKLADAFVAQNEEAHVLIVCVELCTLHVQAGADDDALLANALFGDGAAACIVSGKRLRGPAIAMERFATYLAPDSGGDMAWKVTASGFKMRLSTYVPKILRLPLQDIYQQMQDTLQAAAKERLWAIHPGGKAIVDSAIGALHLGRQAADACLAVLNAYGNMSSATVLYVIKRILGTESGEDKPLSAIGFGPGLTIEMMHGTCLV